MSTRSIASIVVPSLLLLFAAIAFTASSASAAASATASPGVAPDSYMLRGSGFAAGAPISVYDASACGGETVCANDYVVGKTTADSTGAFIVGIQLDSNFRPSAGQVHRAVWIQNDDTREGPLVQLPLTHDGVPKPPATGNTTGDAASLPSTAIIVAALGIAALSTLVVGTVVARRG